jgi:hypothetical protein
LCDEHYEQIDKDLPVKHAAQVAWNALARLELMIREEEDAVQHELLEDLDSTEANIKWSESTLNRLTKDHLKDLEMRLEQELLKVRSKLQDEEDE